MPDADKIELSLRAHHIPEDLIAQILAGRAAVGAGCKREEKAQHLLQVIQRIDETLDPVARAGVMEWCACCKTGQRDKDCKQYAKVSAGKSLKERVEGLAGIKNMGRPRLNEDGSISTWIHWEEQGRYRCPCPNFIGLEPEEPVSTTYCTCCAGHFRYHYQNALQLKLKTRKVASSVLNSQGKEPCHFIYEISG